MVLTTMRTYSELISLPTFEERYDYVRISDGVIGNDTFGQMRWINQQLYSSPEWKQLRNHLIVRDNNCNLAHPDYPIFGKVILHHLNPITIEDFEQHRDVIFDPENLVCVCYDLHNRIHFGRGVLPGTPAERTANDTCPWRL